MIMIMKMMIMIIIIIIFLMIIIFIHHKSQTMQNKISNYITIKARKNKLDSQTQNEISFFITMYNAKATRAKVQKKKKKKKKPWKNNFKNKQIKLCIHNLCK